MRVHLAGCIESAGQQRSINCTDSCCPTEPKTNKNDITDKRQIKRMIHHKNIPHV